MSAWLRAHWIWIAVPVGAVLLLVVLLVLTGDPGGDGGYHLY
jgi:hypothetical protein